MEFLSRTDSYLKISRKTLSGEWEGVHKTEVVKRSYDPRWSKFSISLQKLSNGDIDRPLLLECYDSHRTRRDELIGCQEISLRSLIEYGKKKSKVDLINPKKLDKKGYQNSGLLQILCCEPHKEFTFLDYVKGGLKMDLMVAVDFTASNGDPDFATSLHYRNPFTPNDYIRAIRAVGEVLEGFSEEKHLAFGFGAKTKKGERVSHCFPLNGNQHDPSVIGVDGILNSYQDTLEKVVLQGPTNFQEIISRACLCAEEAENTGSQSYTTLLILTDGVISDMEATIAEIVRGSSLPLSILIIGIGSADFRKMDILDGNEPLVHNGIEASRNIVQFVPFSNFKEKHYSCLGEFILKEIPEQILCYYKSNRIQPGDPSDLMNPKPVQKKPENQSLPTTYTENPLKPFPQNWLKPSYSLSSIHTQEIPSYLKNTEVNSLPSPLQYTYQNYNTPVNPPLVPYAPQSNYGNTYASNGQYNVPFQNSEHYLPPYVGGQVYQMNNTATIRNGSIDYESVFRNQNTLSNPSNFTNTIKMTQTPNLPSYITG